MSRLSLRKCIGFVLLVTMIPGVIMGCKNGDNSDISQNKGNLPDWEDIAANDSGNVMYRQVTACGEYSFDQTGKQVHNSDSEIGQWVLSDKKEYGEECPNKWDISCIGFNNEYEIGDSIRADVTFRIEGCKTEDLSWIYGAIYFADLQGGDGSLESNIAVREYFSKYQNDDTYAAVEMSHFGGDNDGRSGGLEEDNGDIECYFNSTGMLPRLTADGEKLYVVLDISDEAGTVMTHRLWEYTYRIGKQGDSNFDLSDENLANNPEYFSTEHAGHWRMSDIRYVGGDGEIVQDGDITITAERYGVEGQHMIYTFEGKDGFYHRLRVQDFKPELLVYTEDISYFYQRIYDYRNQEDAKGLIHCSIALGDVDFQNGKYGVTVSPEIYFHNYRSGDVKTFDAPATEGDESNPASWKGEDMGTRMNLEGTFPEGEKTGDKMYLCVGVKDGFSGNVRMYNIYEYTYTQGPDVEWIYNPPGY